MEDSSQIFKDFEHILKNNAQKTRLALYSDSGNQSSMCPGINKTCCAKDVIVKVNQQIRAMQRADTSFSCKQDKKKLEKYKKSTFLPVNSLPRENEVTNQNPATRFETQCVSDTQLIDIIANAEAIAVSNNGITQEFDTTFHQLDDTNEISPKENPHTANNVIENRNPSIIDERKASNSMLEIVNKNFTSKNPSANVEKNSQNAENINTNTQIEICKEFTESDNNFTQENITQGSNSQSKILNKVMQSNSKTYEDRPPNMMERIDEVISPSPIFQVRKSKTPSPLVFDLGSFETFEKIALPILEENSDLNSAKQLINSQILGKELLIQTNMKSASQLANEPTSPILKISNEKFKITKTPEMNIDLNSHTNKEFLSSKNDKESSFLKDEILFSSDEENEYEHKELQDIPLTCALETSFYEQPDVLDRTMYVGFQTASNRSIQITTDSFTKAKSLLDEIEKGIASSASLAELVDNLSSKHESVTDINTKIDDKVDLILKDTDIKTDLDHFQSVSINNECVLKHSLKKTETDGNEPKDDREEEIEVFKRPEKRKFDGFMMASKKKIKLSDMALARCKRVFQDIGLEEDFANTKETETKSAEKDVNRDKLDHTDIDDDILQEFSRDMSLIEDENDAAEFVGFKTVSRKNIKISDAALAKTKNLFDDIDSKFDQPSTSKEFCGFKTASCKNIKISNAALKKSNEIFLDIMNKNEQDIINYIEKQNKPNEVDTFTGFKTANNKYIKISEQALLRTRDTFKDIDTENKPIITEENKIPKTEMSTMNHNNIIDLNSEMCEDLSKVFENEILDIEIEKPLSGFQTANKKPIHISEKALQDSKKLFADELYECDSDVISKPAILKKSHTDNIANNNHFPENVVLENRSLFFKTANNKPINISKHALERSKKLFENLQNINERDEDKELIPFRGFKSQKTKSTNTSDVTLVKTDVMLNDKGCNVSDAKQLEGFKTANNKPIHITSEALAKSKALFEDIDEDGSEQPINTKNIEHDKHKDDQSVFKGFHTANNKPIRVSSEALAKSKALFKDLDSDDAKIKDDTDPELSIVPAFKGFQTANNKPIRISKEALKRSKALFQDIDNESKSHEPIAPSFNGFQTASNKLIHVSSEALSKSKAIFKDLDGENNSIDKIDENVSKNKEILAFKGFHTASNKQINVSSDALARSKLLFKDINETEEKAIDIDNTNSGLFRGFQTGNKKPVPISAEALARSKALFKDIDNEANNSHNTVDAVSSFAGFKTANQKPISISIEALAKSKAVFEGIDKDESNTKENFKEFKGFQTASNKAVKVSEEALIKSKKIFEEFDNCKENETNLIQFKGFQTASNKRVNISEQALKRTRQIFQDIDLTENCKENITETEPKTDQKHEDIPKLPFGFKSASGAKVNITAESLKQSKKVLADYKKTEVKLPYQSKRPEFVKPQESLEKLIDTQVITDFEETLHTEDFCKTTPRPVKRSGSPILSCPRAKKRKKFATPFKNDEKSSIVNLKSLNKDVNIEKENVLFNINYKKNKRLTLKNLAIVEEKSKNTNIDPYILNFNLENILEFEFIGQRNDITDGKLSIEHLKVTFQNAVNKKLIPIGWIENHLKLIIWKLISYEIKFPKTLTRVCTAKNVLEQLKYRFDRELYNAERPALRKILEKDDVASKTMVLCVAGIFADGVSVQSVTNIASNVELLVSDGWYCIKACLDKMLTKLVVDEKITIGCKIVTTGAELINCEQGVAPWEDTTAVRLKISGNSTRRARWDARLGYHSDAAMLTKLSSVKPEGGKVSKLRLFVARAYPMLYVEKFEDGSTVTRSERLEHIHQVKYESERQIAMEKLYEEVEKELSDQESQDSLESQIAAKHRKMDGSMITESQAKSLEERSNRKRERLLLNIQERVRKKIEQKGLNVGRNVVTLLKVRVAGVEGEEGHISVTKGFLSIWKPNDMLTEIIKEGSWIEVMNIVPTAVRYSEIHLSAGRQSVFSQSKYQENNHIKPYTSALRRKCYHIKDLAQNPTMITDYNEVDTVGLIFHIDEVSNQPFQNVYLTDAEKNRICINFWGGLVKFGFQNILQVGQIIYGTNLQKRAGNTRKSIPQFRVTEFTNFTKTPKNVDGRNVIDSLEKKLSNIDKKKYCQECVILKNNFSSKNLTENVSPYRFHDLNLNKNKVYIDSPLATKCEDNYNLTGLDFESTFKQTDTQELSPKTLQRKRQVKQKIAKLKMIGEPPPLSPLNIINKSRCAFNSYRSPLANSVASPKNIYQNSRIQDESSVNNSNQTNVTNVNNCQNSSFNNITSSPVIQCVNKSKSDYILKKSYQNSRIEDDVQSSPLIQNINTKKYQNVTTEKQASQLLKINVTNVKKSYQNSRITEGIQSSPVFGMNRTYVKNVNPVKLDFSAQDNSLEEVVDHFAEEFDDSPPLSLD